MWDRLGDVPNYVEPFFGSGAVLLARPDAHDWADRTETVNDLDGFISNYWRATQADPETVAHWADWPANENDLHARHSWLVARKGDLQARLEGDPDFYDAKVAGWWLWGICLWIGVGWCSGRGPWHQVDGQLVRQESDGKGVERKLVHLGDGGRGINRQLVHLGNDGRGINRQLVHLRGGGQGINRQRVHLGNGAGSAAEWSDHLKRMMQALADRLRRVRVCCGDWSRVCGPTPTYLQGLTGVFLDPPYALTERDAGIYRVDADGVSTAVRDWAVENGQNPLLRIALCGYEGEHEMPAGWQVVAWKAKGGYGSQGEGMGRENSARERIWFSPHCLKAERPIQGALL